MEQEINVKKKIEISKEDFKAYERVRKSGVTNMFMVSNVCAYSGLSREKVLAIMEGYDKLVETYPNVREE